MPDLAATWRITRRTVMIDVALALAVSVAVVGHGRREASEGWPDLAAAGVTLLLFLVRHRFAVPALQAGIAAALIATALTDRPTSLFPALIVLLFTAALTMDRRRAIVAGVATMVSILAVIAMLEAGGVPAPEALAGFAWPALALAAADIVRGRRAAMTTAIETASERARVAERLRIARELHDVVAHRIAVVNVQAGVAAHLLRSQPEQAEEALAVVRSSARTVLDELGGILSVLRGPGDGTADGALEPAPLLDSLPALVSSFTDAGLAVTWETTGAPRPLTDAVQLAIYRTVQEALTNAHKHGDGTARFSLIHAADGVTVDIENDQGSAAPNSGGFGLIGMRERVTAAGGTLETGARGRNFGVHAWFPVAAGTLVP